MEMISVIIPVYNAEKTLSATVSSVLSQSYHDLELLLINDGSWDGSGALCERFAEDDARVRIFHQINAGVSAARNLGLKQAGGAYVTFLDADDIIPKNYLEKLYETCQEADLAICDVICIQRGQETNRFTLPEMKLNRTEALNYLFRRQGINSGPCGKLFRRETVEGVVFPPLKAYEDILFVRDVFCRAEKIAVTDGTEYRYMQNPDGAMSTFFKAPSTDIIKASKSNLEFIVRHPELSPETFYITVSHVMQYVQEGAWKDRNNDFVRQTQKMYRRYILRILSCSAFPWKEKFIYMMFAFGWMYLNRKFVWIGG